MIFTDPKLFERAAQDLLQHASHKLFVVPIGGDAAPESMAIKCENCHEALIEFLPEYESERPDPERVQYEGRYEKALDLCYIEVSKPGKSPLSDAGAAGPHQPFANRHRLGLRRLGPSPVFIRDLDGLLGRRAARTSSVPRLQVHYHSQTASESTVDADRRADRALHPKNWGSEEVSAERAPLILNSQSTTLK